MVLEDLGPSFMKLGQIASTRADLLPQELIDELKKLQDDVPPVDFAAIKAEVESSLAAPIAEISRRSRARRWPRRPSGKSTAPGSGPSSTTTRETTPVRKSATWWSRCSGRACARTIET